MIFEKIKIKLLERSTRISIIFMVSYLPKDEQAIKNYIKKFNDKYYSNNKSPIPNFDLVENDDYPDNKEIEEFRNNFKDNKKGKITSKVIGTKEEVSLSKLKKYLSNIEDAVLRFKKEAPKNLSFDISETLEFMPDEDFTEEKVEMLRKAGYSDLPLISYKQMQKELKKF